MRERGQTMEISVLTELTHLFRGRSGGDGFVLYFDLSMKQYVFSEPQSLKVVPLRLRDENPRIHIVTPKSLCINPKQSSYTIFLKSNTRYYVFKNW